MGGSSTPSKIEEFRHAPYVESRHSAFLDVLFTEAAAVIDDSPYAGYDYASVDADFFGAGYLISSYPSLYDHFGKFMAGLDLEYLWNECMADLLTPSEISALVVEQVKELDEKVTREVAAFTSQMRNINAVTCSSFVIGAAKIEDRRVKDRATLSAQAAFSLIPTAQTKWKGGINHNMGVVRDYARTMLTYYSSRMETDEGRLKLVVDDKLWPFTVLDYEQKGLGVFVPRTPTSMKQQMSFSKTTAGKAMTIVSWVATGAYIGWYAGSWYPGVGNVVGAVIGGVVGLIIGVAQVLFLDE